MLKREKMLGAQAMLDTLRTGDSLNYMDYSLLAETVCYVPPRTASFLDHQKEEPYQFMAKQIRVAVMEHDEKSLKQQQLSPSEAATNMFLDSRCAEIARNKHESLKYRVIAGADDTMNSIQQLDGFSKLTGLNPKDAHELLTRAKTDVLNNGIEPMHPLQQFGIAVSGAFNSTFFSDDRKQQLADAAASHEGIVESSKHFIPREDKKLQPTG